MFTSNPFAELSASVSPTVMQTYVAIMAILVVAGTLFDVIHKGSAKYFFASMGNLPGSAPAGSGQRSAAPLAARHDASAEAGSIANAVHRKTF